MPHRREYAVAVVGAGPAGVAAAAAAADCGAGRVILIEGSRRLGGSVSAAMHRCICGLYARAPQNPLDTLNGGTQREIVAHMVRQAPDAVLPRKFGRSWVLEFPSSAWEASLSAICSNDKIDRRIGCRVTGLQREGASIAAIKIDGPASEWIGVGSVIDCTGAGAVLQLAGDDVTLPPDDAGRMLGGFSIRFGGLTGDIESLRLQTPYVLAQAVARGTLRPEARFTMFHPGPGDGEGICKLAVNPAHFSAQEVESFSQGVVAHLIHEIPGFSAARVVECSPGALARDGRRLRANFVMMEADVLEARRHGANAVHAWWPIEHWDISAGPTYAYPPDGEHYDIPGDALRSNVVKNLFAAGMCISATAGAAASLRASGICLATGHAAGLLAAALVS